MDVYMTMKVLSLSVSLCLSEYKRHQHPGPDRRVLEEHQYRRTLAPRVRLSYQWDQFKLKTDLCKDLVKHFDGRSVEAGYFVFVSPFITKIKRQPLLRSALHLFLQPFLVSNLQQYNDILADVINADDRIILLFLGFLQPLAVFA